MAEFFAIAGTSPNLECWIEPYLTRLKREEVWTARDLQEIRRAIRKWLEDTND